MKKLKLTVAQPCHEDWNQMTPDQKGRFCGSCQRTVVDFTSLNDRQILEYFKKPAGSLCGRFYNDQLNRPFIAPRKRLPWVKYFFQFTWPAFVLFLKSCAPKTTSLGEYAMKVERTTELVTTTGITLVEITPVDTVKPVSIQQREVVGELVVDDVPDSETYVMRKPLAPIDSLEHQDRASVDTGFTEFPSVDTSRMQLDEDTLQYVTLGKVAVCTKESKPLKSELRPRVESSKPEFMIYPNPITAGQKLKANVEQKTSGYFKVLSISGQVMHFGEVNIGPKQTFEVEIKSWPAGSYIFQLVDENNGRSSTQKFLVQ